MLETNAAAPPHCEFPPFPTSLGKQRITVEEDGAASSVPLKPSFASLREPVVMCVTISIPPSDSSLLGK